MKYFLLILFSALVYAEDIYVAQSDAGGATGADCANAHSMAWLNTGSNWASGAGKVSPGDTVHLCGTFTTAFVIPGSGTAGSPVTIYFESGAKFSTGCWSSSGAIQLQDVSYITIDGGTVGNGRIENTSNGVGLATQNSSRGIGGNVSGTGKASNLIIQNLVVTNIFHKVKGDDMTGIYREGYGIDLIGSSITVSNCWISDGDGPLGYACQSNSTNGNVRLVNNTILNYNHGIAIGVGDTNSTLTNLFISGNLLDHSDVWDTQGGTQIHLDAIIILNNNNSVSSQIQNFHINGNTFGGNCGIQGTTAGIFTDVSNPQYQIQNYYIYNNLFLAFPGNSWGNGFISSAGSNLWVFNNSCMGTNLTGTNYGGSITLAGTNAFLYNNIISYGYGFSIGAFTATATNATTDAQRLYNLTSYVAGAWSDYNIILGSYSDSPAFSWVVTSTVDLNTLWNSGSINPEGNGLANWKGYYPPDHPTLTPFANAHADPHSGLTAPSFVTGTYIPTSTDTVARFAGLNLGTTPGVTAVDILGRSRPTSGGWTIGAFEADSGASFAARGNISASGNFTIK